MNSKTNTSKLLKGLANTIFAISATLAPFMVIVAIINGYFKEVIVLLLASLFVLSVIAIRSLYKLKDKISKGSPLRFFSFLVVATVAVAVSGYSFVASVIGIYRLLAG
ncbi:hypothetical protein CW740_03710 [Kangiella profundi]|uniref:Uncharacterized protein n=1 Tax=Kangiella profundi TaxID=1561924 RepID=A0A2K9ATB1_9GAMM|nr:hypothetical protein CW740_03710 [Kangiella profundi]